LLPCIAGPRHQFVATNTKAVAKSLDAVVMAALDQPPGWAWTCTAHLARMLELILHHQGIDRPQDTILEQVAALLDPTPDRHWSTVAVARALHIPLSTLAHRFSAAAGTPLSQWMRERRLARARLLLRQGLSVVAVADHMGFSSPFQLSRAYSAWAGHPPSTEARMAPQHPLLRQ